MANMKFSGSRKTAVILLLILFLVVGGTGSYLLWRVNQQKTVAPTDSEANGCPDNCVWPYVSWYFTGKLPGTEEGCHCAPCNYDREGAGPYCLDREPSCNPAACPSGYTEFRYNWNCEAMMSGGESDRLDEFLRSHGIGEKDNPVLCRNATTESVCMQECSTVCAGCNNPYRARRYCVKNAPEPECGDGIVNQEWEECDPPDSTCPNGQICTGNCKCPEPQPVVCDGAGKQWLLNPNGKTYQTCTSFNYKYQIGSSQGVDTSSVDVRIGSTVITPTITPSADGKTATVEGTLNGSGNCLSVGTKELTIKWKAKGEATYSNTCSDSATFTIKEIPPAVCDGKDKGSAITFDPSPANLVFNKGSEFTYSYKIGDSVGIDLSSVQVQVSNTIINGSTHPQPVITPNTGTPKTATVTGKLNSTVPLYVGKDKPITIRWKRVGETSYNKEKCEKTATFTINECDGVGKKWEIIPPATIVEGKSVPFKYITGDTDGVRNTATGLKVLLNGVNVTGVTRVPSTTNSPTVTVSGTLSGLTPSATPYKLEIIWNDIYGAGGAKCSVSTTIKVDERKLPEWDIDKVAIEECIDDGTENPQSKITNTITVRNTGSAEGSIKRIVDTLDSKVVGSTVSNISNGGVYADGKITWTFNPADVYTPGQSKTFTYSYIVSKDKFGIYDNTAVATTVADNTFQAGASIEARCNVVSPSCGDGNVDTGLGEQCDPPGSACTDVYGNASVCTNQCSCPGEAPVPKTGIFDDSRNIVILGSILLFTGLGWTWISNTYSLVNGKLVQKRKESFEKRVVKR